MTWAAIIAAISAFFQSIPVIGDWLKRREERKAKLKLAEQKAGSIERWQTKDQIVNEAIRKAAERGSSTVPPGGVSEPKDPSVNP